MLKSLLNKRGNVTPITISNYSSNPCLYLSGRKNTDRNQNILATLEVIEEYNFHEPPPQEDIKSLFNHLFQIGNETKELWTTFNGEQPLELEVKEFLMHLS
jgi:hypothetical protein